MNKMQRQVEEFHRATGSTIGDTPEFRDDMLRADLILEEFKELLAAMSLTLYDDERRMDILVGYDYTKEDLPKAIDAIADLLYVVIGTAVTWGIDIEPFFDEVHRSNMSKAGPDGKVIRRADGKILKPDTYSPPDIAGVLEHQEQCPGAICWHSLA